MKKFSKIDSTIFESKKYKERSKNDIYSLIKENIRVGLRPLNENSITNVDNVKIDIDGTLELVEKINKYICNKINEEKIKVLQSIKSSIATGTLNIKRINEEIESCEYSEICPDMEVFNLPKDKEELDEFDEFNEFDNLTDYYDDLNEIEEDSIYITTNLK